MFHHGVRSQRISVLSHYMHTPNTLIYTGLLSSTHWSWTPTWATNRSGKGDKVISAKKFKIMYVHGTHGCCGMGVSDLKERHDPIGEAAVSESVNQSVIFSHQSNPSLFVSELNAYRIHQPVVVFAAGYRILVDTSAYRAGNYFWLRITRSSVLCVFAPRVFPTFFWTSEVKWCFKEAFSVNHCDIFLLFHLPVLLPRDTNRRHPTCTLWKFHFA